VCRYRLLLMADGAAAAAAAGGGVATVGRAIRGAVKAPRPSSARLLERLLRSMHVHCKEEWSKVCCLALSFSVGGRACGGLQNTERLDVMVVVGVRLSRVGSSRPFCSLRPSAGPLKLLASVQAPPQGYPRYY